MPVHLLPYHSLGDSKLDSLESGKCRLDILPLGEEQMNDLKKLMSDAGLMSRSAQRCREGFRI